MTVWCNLPGRYIGIVAKETKPLQICEVEAIVRVDPSINVLRLPGVTT